VQKVVL